MNIKILDEITNNKFVAEDLDSELLGVVDINLDPVMDFIYVDIQKYGNIILVQNWLGLYGAYDLDYKEVVSPNYLSVVESKGDYLVTKLDGKRGVLSSNGSEKIPCKYDNIQQISNDIYIVRNDDEEKEIRL